MIAFTVWKMHGRWNKGGPVGPSGGLLFAIYFSSKRRIFLCVPPIFGPSAGTGFEDAPHAYYYSTPCSLQDSSIGSEDASFLIRFLEL